MNAKWIRNKRGLFGSKKERPLMPTRIKVVEKEVKPYTSEELAVFSNRYLKNFLGKLATVFRLVENEGVNEVLEEIFTLMKQVNKKLRALDKDAGKIAKIAANPPSDAKGIELFAGMKEDQKKAQYRLYDYIVDEYNGGMFGKGISGHIQEVYPELGSIKIPQLKEKEYLAGDFKRFDNKLKRFAKEMRNALRDNPVIKKMDNEKWFSSQKKLNLQRWIANRHVQIAMFSGVQVLICFMGAAFVRQMPMSQLLQNTFSDMGGEAIEFIFGELGGDLEMV